MSTHTVDVSSFTYSLFISKKTAPFWFLVRLYVGYEWLVAGYEKVVSPAWFGSSAGAALTGFARGAIAKSTCPTDLAGAVCHLDVQTWYASFLQSTVLPHVMVWSNLVTVGEILVGLGLIVGLCTEAAAFFGVFMNLNFLLAGTVSTNPMLLVLGLGILLARRPAGYWGLDHYAMPFLRRTRTAVKPRH
ncbi:DoxX family protein [Candidatus Kaiserbacteria bacterium CG10_big_fil_rev_8_21_14_0_10_56_12]|uniref:DoxX family protein n=1 Tax=Candidatus Kaiserbacteria bacterium CG10_big_fil_rev_8_21_14_0_10_56_12 TaxID=1974611 RepID=A0A2H0U951_9BACT|nr:MAG: DoxX family protein [Candidatus Kaiserbacteria bacterium CG10_big_fil_rev_8_21_14_0_10_56_12]